MRRSVTVFLLFWTFGLALATAQTAKRGPRTMRMEATAYVLDDKPTASGTVARVGAVAADPKVLPFGSRVRISNSRGYDGVYKVTDTGAHMDGRRIDIFVSSAARAKQFGRRMVTVQVLEYGKGKDHARTSPPSPGPSSGAPGKPSRNR